jgi:hypothetical protein
LLEYYYHSPGLVVHEATSSQNVGYEGEPGKPTNKKMVIVWRAAEPLPVQIIIENAHRVGYWVRSTNVSTGLEWRGFRRK